MQALLKYLAYPLAIKLAGWIYDKYIKHQVEDNEKEINKQRNALMKAISKADNDEDRATYSIILNKLSRGQLQN